MSQIEHDLYWAVVNLKNKVGDARITMNILTDALVPTIKENTAKELILSINALTEELKSIRTLSRSNNVYPPVEAQVLTRSLTKDEKLQ